MRTLVSTLVTLSAVCLVTTTSCSKTTGTFNGSEVFCDVQAVPCAANASTFNVHCCSAGKCASITNGGSCSTSGTDCIDDAQCNPAVATGCSAVLCQANATAPLQPFDPSNIPAGYICPTIPAAPVGGFSMCFVAPTTTVQECQDACNLGGPLNAALFPVAARTGRCTGTVDKNHTGLGGAPLNSDGSISNACPDPFLSPPPLASEGTNAVSLSGGGTANFNNTSTAVSIIGGSINVAAPNTSCTTMSDPNCLAQINAIEVRFSDFTLDGHSVKSLRLELQQPFLSGTGAISGNSFAFEIPATLNELFNASATVDGSLAGLVVTSQEAKGSVDLSTGEVTFQFDFTGVFDGQPLEMMGAATTAKLVALAPVVTEGPISITDSTTSCTASVTLSASASSTLGLPVSIIYMVDGQVAGTGSSATTTLSIGNWHSVAIQGTDTNGMSDTVGTPVTPTDNVAPVVTTITSPITLWPPNHEYVAVTLDQCVTSVVDQCDGSLNPMTHGQIVNVTSNEQADDPGSGNTCNDVVIASNNTVNLRAERDGRGQGRVYTIHFTESDSSGNKTPATCVVQVPHELGTPASNTPPVMCVGTSCGTVPGPHC
jgi:hypothetical protein